MGLREVACSRSLDNITILILGLKGLKRTIKKLNKGQTLQSVRQQLLLEQRGIQNTYEQDFFEVEINEEDLFNANYPHHERGNSQGADPTLDEDIFEISEQKGKAEKQGVPQPKKART